MNLLMEYLNALFSLTREMAPYLLFGFIIAGILHVYVPRGAFTKYFGKRNLKSILYASLMGIPLPLCSCGVIPTGISLYKEGASKGATLSFLISTPQTGVDSIMVTYSLLGLPFAIVRPFIALVNGVIGGVASNVLDQTEESHSFHDSLADEKARDGNKLKRILNYSFDELFNDIGDWLFIGLALAAVIAVLIPEEFFQSAVMSNEIASMLIVLLASIPFYVCATGSVPIAAVLLMKGLNPGAVLVFLMAGPATNIATITVIAKTLGKKTFAIYLGSIVLTSFVFGLLLNRLFPPDFFTVSAGAGHDHGNSFWSWIENISTAIFIFFLLRSFYLKMMNWRKKRQGAKTESDQTLNIEVVGMTCNNCAAKVESVLLDLPEVNQSAVNLEEKKVELKGHNIDLKKVKERVEGAGYVYNDVVE